MSGTTPTDRFVFDTYAEQAVTVYSGERLPASVVVVADDAICNLIDGASMPQSDGDYVTVAGPHRVARGKCISLAYVIQLDAANSEQGPQS